jgi:hypothetical protein
MAAEKMPPFLVTTPCQSVSAACDLQMIASKVPEMPGNLLGSVERRKCRALLRTVW